MMKKRTTRLLLPLLLCVSLLLSACGGDSKPPEDTPKPTPEAAETPKPKPKPTPEPEGPVWPDLDPSELRSEELEGVWFHSVLDVSLEFDGVDSFWLTDYTDDDNSVEGKYQFDGVGLYLKDRGGDVLTGSMDSDGDLSLDGLDGWFCLDSEDPEPEPEPMLSGVWTYNLGAATLDFDEMGGYTCTTVKDEFEGTYTLSESYLELYRAGEYLGCGNVDTDGRIRLDNFNGWFYPEGGTTYEALSNSDSLKLGPNSTPSKQSSRLANAVAIHNEANGVYERADADWSVVQDPPNPAGEGRKAIPFAAVCLIPYSTLPDVDGPVALTCPLYFYDLYTGTAFVIADDQLVDGVYRYEFDSRDGRVLLELDLERESDGPVGNYFLIQAVRGTAYVPDWYDGFMIAPVQAPVSADDLEGVINDPSQSLGHCVLDDFDGIIETAYRYNLK